MPRYGIGLGLLFLLACGGDITSNMSGSGSSGDGASSSGTDTSGAEEGGACSESDLPPPFCHTLVRVEHSESRPSVLLPLPNAEAPSMLVWTNSEATLVDARDFSNVRGTSDTLIAGTYLRLFTGDFDGDEVLDVGMSNDGPQEQIRVYSGIDLRLIADSPPSTYVRPANAMDLDGDARDEIVSTLGPVLQVWSVQGSELSLREEYPDLVSPCGPNRILRGDFDGDSASDLAIPTSAIRCSDSHVVPAESYHVKVLFSGDPNTVGGPSASAQHNLAWEGASGDIDGDGLADLVLQDGEGVTVLRAEPGTFSVAAAKSWEQLGGGTTHAQPLVGDVDGDGRADLILFGFNGDLLGGKESHLYWAGDLDSEPYVFPVENQPTHLADLDLDGRSEIMTVLREAGTTTTGIYWSL